METEPIGKKIRQMRTSMGLTQKKFSEIIGITQAHLSGVETGKDNPSDSLLRIISNEFDVALHWLKYGEGSIHKSVIDVDAFIASLPIEDKPQPIEEDLKAILSNKNSKAQEAFRDIVGLFREMTGVTETTTGFDLLTVETLYCMLFSIHDCLSRCTMMARDVGNNLTKQDYFVLLGRISHNIMECKSGLVSDLDDFQKTLVNKLNLQFE